jgi:hypothetical protein
LTTDPPLPPVCRQAFRRMAELGVVRILAELKKAGRGRMYE